MGLVVASLWHGILQRGGKRERAGSGIELKTSLGNKKKTDTPSIGVIQKRQTHRHWTGSGIELKTFLGNMKKTDTPTWHLGNKKKTDTQTWLWSKRLKLEVVPLCLVRK